MILRRAPRACSRRRVRIAAALVLAVLVVPSGAAADDAGIVKEREAEIEQLVRSIATDAQSLSTDDCVSACKALDSMRRATARLCSLDSGRRCTDARAVLDD